MGKKLYPIIWPWTSVSQLPTQEYTRQHKGRYIFYLQCLPMVKYILQNDSIFLVSMVILKVNANVDDAPLQEMPCVKANIKGGL